MILEKVFNHIFNSDVIAYGDDFIISMPFEKRRRINPDQTLQYSYYNFDANLPKWLRDFDSSHLGPCEKEILLELASDQKGLIVFRGGARSGKSSTIAHIVNYANDYMTFNNSLKELLEIESFMQVLHFDDIPLDKEKSGKVSFKNLTDCLCKAISDQLEGKFIEQSISHDKEYHFYRNLIQEVFINDLDKKIVIPNIYYSIQQIIRSFCKKNDKGEYSPTDVKIAIRDHASPEIELVAKLLPFITLGRTAKTNFDNAKYILVLDNIDILDIELQNYLYSVLKDLFESGLNDIGITVCMMLRHGSFTDPKQRFSRSDLRAHNALPASEAAAIKIIDFLIHPKSIFETVGITLSDKDRNQIIQRAFSFWYHILNSDSDFYTVLDALSGTNIQTAYEIIISWLISPDHPSCVYTTDTEASCLKNIVKLVSTARLLNQYGTLVGRGCSELVIKSYEFYSNNKELYLSQVLTEIRDVIVSVCIYNRLVEAKNDNDENGSAMRCAISRALRSTLLKILELNNYVDKRLYSFGVDGFLFEWQDKLKSLQVNNEDIYLNEIIILCNEQLSNRVQQTIDELGYLSNDSINGLCNIVITGFKRQLYENERPHKVTSPLIHRRDKENDTQFVGLGKDCEINSYSLLSRHKAAELLIKEAQNNNYGAVNMFANDEAKYNPTRLVLLYLLNNSTTNYSTIGYLVSTMKMLNYKESDTIIAILSFINSDTRLVYSTVSDVNINKYIVENNPQMKIYLTWAGKTYYEELVENPVYIQFMLEIIPGLKNNIDNSQIKHTILNRINFSLECFKILIEDEKNKFNKTRLLADKVGGINNLKSVMSGNLGAVADVFFRSSYSFFYTLSLFKNAGLLHIIVDKISVDWYELLLKTHNEYSELFDSSNTKWEEIISHIQKDFSELLEDSP